MKLLKTLILLFTLMATTAIQAHNKGSQTIHGVVVDEITGHPLPGAYIILVNASPIKGTTTDLNGQFILPEVPLGRQSIKISYLG